MQKMNVLAGVGVASAALTAHATVLTFDNFDAAATPPVPGGYGDRVTALVDPATGYAYGLGNGFTPNILVDYLPDVGETFEIWNGYAGLDRAMGDDSFNVPGEVVFTGDPGFQVVLNSFDLAPWTAFMPNAQVSVTDGAGNVLFSQTFTTGGVEESTTVSFAGGLRAPILRLRVNNFGDWAIDNVNFDQDFGGCNDADLAAPVGLLDLADVTAFASAFIGQLPPGDINEDGLFDLSDVNAFINAFLAGCP